MRTDNESERSLSEPQSTTSAHLTLISRVLWQTVRYPLSASSVSIDYYDTIPGITDYISPTRGRRPRRIPIGDKKIKTVSVSQAFKLVFWGVLALTVGSGLGQVWAAETWYQGTPYQQAAFASMEAAWKMGTGAIIGLLGGKVT